MRYFDFYFIYFLFMQYYNLLNLLTLLFIYRPEPYLDNLIINTADGYISSYWTWTKGRHFKFTVDFVTLKGRVLYSTLSFNLWKYAKTRSSSLR
jgi:hypothetical protein